MTNLGPTGLAAVALSILLLAMSPAGAVSPDEVLADPVLETRAREISKGLRCVVCRNQSIDDSNAAIARDMRILLREQLAGGATDEEAMTFFVQRYGNYVLLKPPVEPSTYLLWAGPLILLILTGYGFSRLFRKPGAAAPETVEISETDKRLVAELLEEGEQK